MESANTESVTSIISAVRVLDTLIVDALIVEALSVLNELICFR